MANISTVDWSQCQQALNEAECQAIDGERGFPIEFTRTLRYAGLIGMLNGSVAFPVHDNIGNVVALHCRQKNGGWFYTPKGVAPTPLVIGDIAQARTIVVLESQWDVFALMAGLALACVANRESIFIMLPPDSN